MINTTVQRYTPKPKTAPSLPVSQIHCDKGLARFFKPWKRYISQCVCKKYLKRISSKTEFSYYQLSILLLLASSVSSRADCSGFEFVLTVCGNCVGGQIFILLEHMSSGVLCFFVGCSYPQSVHIFLSRYSHGCCRLPWLYGIYNFAGKCKWPSF